jgi:hypothetical protein
MNARSLHRPGAVLGSLLLTTTLGAPLLAQQTRRPLQSPARPAAPVPPVTVLQNPVPQYRSGEVSVHVRANENPLIRLGLAPNGVTLVEFPANDRFFALNPGNPDLVSIEDSPTKETDRFFVIRPNSSFVPGAGGAPAAAPATSLIVQMNSGMVVTFLLYPVRDLEQHAHRCVVLYDRDAIVSARRAAGLASELNRREPSAAKSSITAIRPLPEAGSTTGERPSPLSASTPSADPPPVTVSPDPASAPASPPPPVRLIEWQLTGKERWSKARHGLRLAVQARGQTAQYQQAAVLVQNTLDVPLVLAPGFPELQVLTLDERQRVLQIAPLKLLHQSSSLRDATLGARQTAFFVLTYVAPVLGAQQRLQVAAATTHAADEPVTSAFPLPQESR